MEHNFAIALQLTKRRNLIDLNVNVIESSHCEKLVNIICDGKICFNEDKVRVLCMELRPFHLTNKILKN